MTDLMVSEDARRRAQRALATSALKAYASDRLALLHGDALSTQVPFATIVRRLRELADEIERRDDAISEL